MLSVLFKLPCSLLIFTFFILTSSTIAWCAEEMPATTVPDKAEIEKVIKILEDPAQRDALLNTLKVLASTDQSSPIDNQLKGVAAQMLSEIATSVDTVTESIANIAGTVNEFPSVASWVKSELTNPTSRKQLSNVAINLILTLGFGYLAYSIFQLICSRFRRTLSERRIDSIPAKLLLLLLNFMGKLLPIVAFTVAAYLTLGIVTPRENTRLVALAWVNGFILSHSIIACFSLFFVPHSPRLRFLKLSDESANYLIIWVKRITYSIIYGYLALQAALLLGLPAMPYDAMLRLLGLFVTTLVIIMIMQNRENVAVWLINMRVKKKSVGEPAEETDNMSHSPVKGPAHRLLTRLARTWHLLAILYVILLFGVWALRIPGGFLFLFKATVLSIGALLVTRVVLTVLHTVFSKGFRVSDDLKHRFPRLEKRANQYFSTLHKILRVACYLFCLIIIMQLWGLNTFTWMTSEPGKVIGSALASVTGILMTTFIIWEIANSLIANKLSPRSPESSAEINARALTLLTVTRKALAIVLIVVSTLMVLAQLGINIAPLLAGAGVLGLAIGFGSQKLVQDVITGIFILLEDQMAVGDVVDLGGMAGVVEAVSIRTVKLRDVAGTVHTIPFSAISTVSNKTKDFSFYVMDIGIGYRENVDDVMKVLEEIGADLQKDTEYGPKIIEPLEILGVDSFADSAVIIKARIKTIPIKQWWVGREFNRRMKLRFDELDIEIPFPHRTIYFGVDKLGGAPSARLTIQNEIGQDSGPE